jgi:hypothetical protein
LVARPEENSALERPRDRWQDNVEMAIEEI